MSSQISHELLNKLRAVKTVASFSPETFHINLGANYVPILKDLSEKEKINLTHEYNHLLNYCTSYVGLKHIFFWAKAITILESEKPGMSSEEARTAKGNEILSNAKERQILCIDDEYYYEPKVDLFGMARQYTSDWFLNDTTGHLYHVDGVLSDRCFWGLRFFLGEPKGDFSNSFVRIPLGMRSILEHMATATDFLLDLNSEIDRKQRLEIYNRAAYYPELLHYYGLSHYVRMEMYKRIGSSELFWNIVITGLLVAILSEIPFDDQEVWHSIQKYGVEVIPQYTHLMKYPHPSFVFPVIIGAAFDSDIEIDEFTKFDKFEQCANKILKKIGLKTIEEYSTAKNELLDKIGGLLGKSKIGARITELLYGMNKYAGNLGWVDKLMNPIKNIGKHFPVPILFRDNGYYDGEFLDMSGSCYLWHLVQRHDEMLRYPISRNIVEH